MKDLKACDDTAGRTTKPARLKYYYIPRGFNVAHNSYFFPNVEATLLYFHSCILLMRSCCEDEKKIVRLNKQKEIPKRGKTRKRLHRIHEGFAPMMSHLLGRAILDQGRDYQPVLGLVFGQTEAETCTILREGMKKSSKSTKQKQKQRKTPLQNISKNLRQDDVLDVIGLCRIRL